MMKTIRLFVLFEFVAFITAASIHFGVLLKGYEHRQAGTAESVIALVLLLGLILTLIRPRSTRWIGLLVQAFALFGTLVGIFTIAIGVGPRTIGYISYHAAIVIVLVLGLITSVRAPRGIES
jgi:heme A synthase